MGQQSKVLNALLDFQVYALACCLIHKIQIVSLIIGANNCFVFLLCVFYYAYIRQSTKWFLSLLLHCECFIWIRHSICTKLVIKTFVPQYQGEKVNK